MQRLLTSLFFLPFLLFSCLEEETILVEPTSESETDPIVEVQDPGEGNFVINGEGKTFDFAYVYSTPSPDGETTRHHLILTRDNVRQGNHLVGSSAAIGLTLESVEPKLEGSYSTAAQAGENKAFRLSNYGNPDFSRAEEHDIGNYGDGEVEIIATDGGYDLTIAFRGNNSFLRLEGSFQGIILPVVPAARVIPDLDDFQGPNTFIRADVEMPITSAYLYDRGNYGGQAPQRYDLLLTESPASGSGNQMTGITNMIVHRLTGNGEFRSGVYGLGTSSVDFLGSKDQLAIKTEPMYCTGFNFQTNNAVEDESIIDGEAKVLHRDGEFMIRLTGRMRNGDEIDALYRGALTVVD